MIKEFDVRVLRLMEKAWWQSALQALHSSSDSGEHCGQLLFHPALLKKKFSALYFNPRGS